MNVRGCGDFLPAITLLQSVHCSENFKFVLSINTMLECCEVSIVRHILSLYCPSKPCVNVTRFLFVIDGAKDGILLFRA